MNQSILFSDDLTVELEKQRVRFSAQQMGSLINCSVSFSWLEEESGESICHHDKANEVFNQLRFDIEEKAEALIEDEEFNASGDIEIN
ncbi:conserved hypothetical protein [Aliivibrio fischeri MJ11]|uniref:Uncharacterized protein n=1 Tax=Aliivibrio fischeri (strain MJ11) TaxID=388396 RepID=B5FCV7_ALIFM|nr:DUF1488 domain-containing protein [Aliivibrio fischeri]ACH64876.1 conserved hypothetical protein [Aliivibrio fischeri MJ11]